MGVNIRASDMLLVSGTKGSGMDVCASMMLWKTHRLVSREELKKKVMINYGRKQLYQP